MLKHDEIDWDRLLGKEVETGLFGGSEAIPLQGISIHVEILDMASRMTLRQRFKNTTGHPIEATYCFPIPSDTAITSFSANVGGKKVKGTVKSRDEAFQDYDKAIEEGNGAFLLDQEKEDIFVTSVGNLKPEEEAEIEIATVSRLDVFGKKICLTIPVTVSPRYAPAHSDPVKVDRISPPTAFEVPYGLTIEVRIRNGTEVGMVSSPSHKTVTRLDGKDMIIHLHQSETALDRDFVLEFEVERYAQPQAFISRHANGDRAIMVSWIPQLPPSSSLKKEGIIFILDCSGSMSGSSIMEAKKALKHCIRRIEPDVPFNAIFFGSDYHALFDEMVPCTGENREKALSSVEHIDADMGGTEIIPPLKAAYDMVGDRFTNILLMTDGEVFNLEDTIALARKNRGRARVFSFGIGYGPSHAFIEGIAKASGGGSVFISPGESIEEKVVQQFNRLSTPEVKDIEIDWGPLDVDNLTDPLPPVFSGEPFVIFGCVRNNSKDLGEVTFRGNTENGPVTFAASIHDLGDDDLVPTLWAKERIQSLESENETATGSRQIERKAEGVRKKIKEVGLKFQLMSSETSFVAILERDEEEKSLEAPVYTRVPVQLTRDWHGTRRAAETLKMCAPVSNIRGRLGPASIRIVENKDDFLEDLSEYLSKSSQVTQDIDSIPLPPTSILLYGALNNCRRDSGEFQWDEYLLSHFGFPVAELERLAESIEGVPEFLKKTVLMTMIAVIFLEKMNMIKGKRLLFISKAMAWLKTLVPDVKVQGKSLREAVESILNVDEILDF